MTSLAAEAVGERLAGRRLSRFRAAIAAAVAGVAAATLVYRVLRSGG
jgi:hypothetical protein